MGLMRLLEGLIYAAAVRKPAEEVLICSLVDGEVAACALEVSSCLMEGVLI